MSNQSQEAALRKSFPHHQPPSAGAGATQMVRQLDTALRIVRMKDLIERTKLSRATLYVLMASDPTFPKKVKLSARSIGFLESEIDGWIFARVLARSATTQEAA